MVGIRRTKGPTMMGRREGRAVDAGDEVDEVVRVVEIEEDAGLPVAADEEEATRGEVDEEAVPDEAATEGEESQVDKAALSIVQSPLASAPPAIKDAIHAITPCHSGLDYRRFSKPNI